MGVGGTLPVVAETAAKKATREAVDKKLKKGQKKRGPSIDPGLDQSILAQGTASFNSNSGIARGRQNFKNSQKRR